MVWNSRIDTATSSYRRRVLAWMLLGSVLYGGAANSEESKDAEHDRESEESAESDDMIEQGGALPALESKSASLRFGLLVQTGFDLLPNQVEGKRNTFTLQRARLRLDGHFVTKNLTYLFEGDAVSGVGLAMRQGTVGSEVLGAESDDDVPFLLDARLSFRIPTLGLTFSIGRFIPKWGLSMPERPSRLGAINYPLYVHGSKDSLGSFRNIGVEAELEVWKYLKAGGGAFNGGKNTWIDDNDRKDILVFFTFNPVAGFEIRASSLFKFPEAKDGVDEDGNSIDQGNETHLIPMVEARYRDYGFDLMAGFASSVVVRHEDDIRNDYEAYGIMAHAGYVLLGDWFQLMGRFEWWEPDNKTSKDDQLRITVGPQLLIKSIHAQFNINYVQDIYAGGTAMCETYLAPPSCAEFEIPPEAQQNAATILIQFVLDL
ncbi:MAG: hypothetical protein GY854_34585 [Deltaproteobacteria bacterium]|nr:hypothetical protein [Deltaproteobacteria bacterium]